MTKDTHYIVGVTTDRKPWTTPMVIVSELEETAAKGAAIGDTITGIGAPTGS